ncbi:MAG TPA: blue light sensor protein, partial [Acinetobacter radioresistens]|nr:blue light sensor protein [Acinetobacter radioresistens]
MIQLCYASKTTSPSDYLLMDLREILSEAQSFNALNSINGVLFYADQYFFQCLEGE